MKLTERINFRQPKYMLPAIVYLPLLGASYFIFDLFDTKVAEKKDANMQTTEYLNPNLPQAHIKGGDGFRTVFEKRRTGEKDCRCDGCGRTRAFEPVGRIPDDSASSITGGKERSRP